MPAKLDRVAPPVDSDEHKKILLRALERVTLAEKGHDDSCREMVENYRAWQGLPHRNSPKKESWQSDFRNPYISNHIRTLTSRTTDPTPSMSYHPTTRVAPETIKLVDKTNDHFAWRDNLMVTQGRSMLHVAIFGQSWIQTSWLYRQQRRKVNATLGEMMNGSPPVRDEMVTLDDRYHHSVAHPFDVMHDPVANVLEECRFVVHRAYASPEQVKAKQRKQQDDGKLVGQYDNTTHDKIKKNGGGRERNVDLPNQMPEAHEARRQGNIELLTIWDRETNTRTVIANREVVLLHGPNPYRHGDLPFSCIVTTPDVMRLGGISEVGKMAAAQAYTWLIENQILDNTRMSMDFILLVRDTIENLDELKIGPGEIWPVRDPVNDVRPLQPPQNQMVGIEHVRDMRGQMQDIIGLSPHASGSVDAMGSENRTAFGIGSVIEEGNKTITNKLAFARALGLERMYDQGLSLLQQYLTTPTIVQMGEDPNMWPQVTWRDMPGRFLVRNRAITDELNKSAKLGNANTLLMALQPWIGAPLPGGKMLDPTPAFELLGQGIEVDADRFLIDMPQDPMQPQAPQGGPLQGEEGTQPSYEEAGAY